jgi:membrane associated rhomboid family serine protease
MTRPPDAGADGQQILDQARDAAARGEYDLASALFARLRGNPNPTIHVAALLGLADARYRLDDEEGALQAWIVATQAPETPLSWQAWVALAGARVRQGDLAAAARCYREAERRAPREEQPAIASRLGWLNKEMGNSWRAQRYFGRARTSGFAPLATYAIVAITVVVSLVVDFAPFGGQLLEVLALDKERVLDGEYWRLASVALVHATTFPVAILHLGFNMYALYIVGPLAEALYGRVIFVVFYVLAAIGGSLASYLFVPGLSVGASGAVFGLFGLLFVSTYIHKPILGRQARALTSQIGMLIVINLVFGFTMGGAIDNAAHVGGLITGAWLGLVVAPRGASTLSRLWQRAAESASTFRERHAGLIAVAGVAVLVAMQGLALWIRPGWA